MTPVTAPVVSPASSASRPAEIPPAFSMMLMQCRSVWLSPSRSAARLSKALSWLPLTRNACTSSSINLSLSEVI